MGLGEKDKIIKAENKVNRCIDCNKKIDRKSKRCYKCFTLYNVGDNNGNWRGGTSPKYSKCIDCGKLGRGWKTLRCKKCYGINERKENNPSWRGGLNHCEKCNKILSNRTSIICFDCLMDTKFGHNNPAWKGGITPLYESIRGLEEYSLWREKVYKRDSYTCQECNSNKGNNFNAHHIKRFSKILEEFLKKYNQFSPIEDKEILIRLAINYKPLWNIKNGITLCKECHGKQRIHKK